MKMVILCTRLSFLVISTALFCQLAAFGQGNLNGVLTFNNFVPGLINAPVSLWDGTGPGLSTGWNAQLVHVAADDQIIPLFPATTFRSTSAAASYYVQQPSENVHVPGVLAGSSATLRMRVWNGPSFETATLRGESNDITVELAGIRGPLPPIPFSFLEGLQGFTIVPEPSIISVVLLGAAALFVRRRV